MRFIDYKVVFIVNKFFLCFFFEISFLRIIWKGSFLIYGVVCDENYN